LIKGQTEPVTVRISEDLASTVQGAGSFSSPRKNSEAGKVGLSAGFAGPTGSERFSLGKPYKEEGPRNGSQSAEVLGIFPLQSLSLPQWLA
jgi:hypothetical protein